MIGIVEIVVLGVAIAFVGLMGTVGIGMAVWAVLRNRSGRGERSAPPAPSVSEPGGVAGPGPGGRGR